MKTYSKTMKTSFRHLSKLNLHINAMIRFLMTKLQLFYYVVQWLICCIMDAYFIFGKDILTILIKSCNFTGTLESSCIQSNAHLRIDIL